MLAPESGLNEKSKCLQFTFSVSKENLQLDRINKEGDSARLSNMNPIPLSLERINSILEDLLFNPLT